MLESVCDSQSLLSNLVNMTVSLCLNVDCVHFDNAGNYKPHKVQ